MVDKFYFMVCLLWLCFICLWGGWQMGYENAKNKYRKYFDKEI